MPELSLPLVAGAAEPLDGMVAWGGLTALIVVLLAVDLFVLRGRGGQMSTKNAAITSVVWIALSVAFAGLLYVVGTTEQATAFLAGYVVEKSLSLDNVFVFLVVLDAFAIGHVFRARLLTYGIVLALVLRLIFILIGATALHHASWLSIPFGLFLLWTGWKLWKERHESGNEEDLVAGIRKRFKISPNPDHGGHFTEREGTTGKRILTAAGAALLTIAIVDIIFAVDSVPAILAITTDTFIVFAANAFALLGLRPLFFLVAHLVERLYYLKAALAVLLMFIAVKMGISEVIGKVPAQWSLLGVGVILGAGVIASLIRDRRQPPTPTATA
ncbi:MAG: TerC/Alx family metal homeostasis membrane protein [Patulibacter minatonensis]